MCDDYEPRSEDLTAAPGGGLSRRTVLRGAVALAAVTALSPIRRATAATPLGGRAQSFDGLTARSLAMHLHASASEGTGSVRAQLQQAAVNGFDVAWFTDHDWRRHRMLFRRTYSFTANELQFGGAWNVAKVADQGALTTDSGGALVPTPVSPKDPATTKGSLRMRATSTGLAQGTARHRIAAEGGSLVNFRGRIAGRTIAVDVLPTKVGPDAWGEVLLRLSLQPGTATRTTGVLTLAYRLRTGIGSRVRRANGNAGIVDVPVTARTWQTVTLDPTEDVRAIWPDVAAEDNSLNEIEFRAVSRRMAPAECFFGYLRFAEKPGHDPLAVGPALLARYASAVPGVLGLEGTEISLGPHLNQYGGAQTPFAYPAGITLRSDLSGIRAAVAAHVHRLGGVVSINHPFAPGEGPTGWTARTLALDLVRTALDGADLLEVGYVNRGTNGTLANHLAAWDAVSRNALFVTGNGVSDDHSGQNWAKQTNRFWTGAWTPELSEAALLRAFRAGRSWVALLGAFSGSIDMSLDGAPMGSVVVGGATSRQLRVDVTGLPAGAVVQVLRGSVDRDGSGLADTSVLRTLSAADLATPLTVDTGADSFFRVQVVGSTGAVIGFGQPVWALDARPSTGVPAERLVSA